MRSKPQAATASAVAPAAQPAVKPTATFVVIGATSEIALATIRKWRASFSETAWRIHLMGRNDAALAQLAPEFDATWSHYDTQMSPEAQVAALPDGAIDVCLCAVGYLGPQAQGEHDPNEAQRITHDNYTGLLPVLDCVAARMAAAGHGQLLVVSSVAGERGRRSNYYYGAAKAALTAYLSGLRIRLLPYGVYVMTIKPGYVRTRMVAGRKLPPYITARPETIARDIVAAARRRQPVLYTMWAWRYIMALTRLIPERLFQHLRRF